MTRERLHGLRAARWTIAYWQALGVGSPVTLLPQVRRFEGVQQKLF